MADQSIFRTDRDDDRSKFQDAPAGQSIFKPTEQPAAPPADERDYEWSEVPAAMLENLPHSAKEFGSALIGPVAHPIDTYNALNLIRRGVMSKIGNTKTTRNTPRDLQGEAAVDALKDFYVQRYGSEKGFRNALARDPVGILADFSTVMTGGGAGAARLLGAAGKAGSVVGRGASIVKDVGESTNPVNIGLRATKFARDPAMNLAMKYAVNPVLSWKNGVPISALEDMRAAGKEGYTPARDQMRGKAPPSDIVDKALDGVQKLADQRRRDYLTSMAGAKSNQTPLPYTEIDKAIAQAKADAMHGNVIFDQPAYDMADALEHTVMDWRTTPNPGYMDNNVEGLDKLKRMIGITRAEQTRPGSSAEKTATQVYNAVKKTITDHDPNYDAAMGQYGDASDQLYQLKKTFGLAASGQTNQSVDQQLRKILLAQKQEGSQKSTLLKQLDEVEPGLSQQVAGHLLQSWFPQGLRGGVGAAIIGAGSGLSFLSGADPTPGNIIGHSVAQAANVATASPRLGGEMNYAAGRVLGTPSGIPTLATAPVFQAGRAAEIAGQPAPPKPRPSFTPEDWGQTPSIDNADPTWDRMLKIESNGRQFDKDGRPLISPKGAVGMAQVLPSTAQDVAQSRGEPFDATALHQDPAYNQRMGRAYYDDLRKQFEDPRLAAAAYNAGPGRVREAQAQAEKTGRPYTEFLPAETRDYLTRLDDDSDIEPAARATGGRVVKHAEKAAALIRAAEKAKKFHVKRTEPLLQKSDDAITSALAVANEHI